MPKNRGTKYQLLIDKMVLADCKRKPKNLAMAWVDYKKAYDMVPHSWIIESLKMAQVAGNIITFSAEISGKLEDRTDIIWIDTWFG